MPLTVGLNFHAMKRWLFLLTGVWLTGLSTLQAQPSVLTMSTRSGGGKIALIADKQSPGTLTTFLYFTTAGNARKELEPIRLFRITESGTLFEIPDSVRGKPNDNQYRYWCLYGYHSTDLDSSFIYRLPFSEYRKGPVEANQLYTPPQERKPNDYIGYQFILNEGDTILAARKGIVVHIGYDTIPPEQNVDSRYRAWSNEVMVEHNDGTLGWYYVLDKESILVREGDWVYPGTPIGFPGSYSGGPPHARFVVLYPGINPDFDTDNIYKTWPLKYYGFTPYFLTRDGVRKLQEEGYYRAASSDALVRREMTRKEIKQFKKNRKK